MVNKCDKCPAYWFERGQEDCDDGCIIRDLEKYVDNCRLPYLVRLIRIKIWEWRTNRFWRKNNKAMNKELSKLDLRR